MKIKFTPTETKNKIFIKIWEKANTRKKEIVEKINSFKIQKDFEVIEENIIENWKTITNLFLIVKNFKKFEENIEDIVINLSKKIKQHNKKFSLSLKNLKLTNELEEIFIELIAQSLYTFTKYKTDKSKYHLDINTTLNSEYLENKIKNIYWARDLMNMPANDLNPDTYESIIKENFKNLPVNIKIIKWEELAKIWANWIYSVWKWSIHQPRMIILTYTPNKNQEYKAIVWKWVTFDSGWYNIKPTWYMEDMNMDMGGSAVSLGIFKFLVENNYKDNLLCAVWLVENLVSHKSYTPTDIIKMYNGKSVRVYNTDAEWRLVLADTLAYVQKNYKIQQIFDFATLTGAAIIALWNDIIAIMGNNSKLNKKIEDISWKIKERCWELPLYKKYKELLKSEFADISNCSKSRAAWTITAGLFLSEFITTKNWVHFDIAWPDILSNHPLYWTGWSWIWIRLGIKLLSQE